MSFECDKCLKSFSTKWNLKRHKTRKNPCVPIDNNNVENSIENNNISSEVEPNEVKSINLYICKYCYKSYNNKYSKYSHQIKCKDSSSVTIKEERIDNIKEIIQKVKNTDKSLLINNDEIKLVKNKNIRKKDKYNIITSLSTVLIAKKIKYIF